MEKERGQVKFVETEEGMRIEIPCDKGKGQLTACCIPLCCRAVGGSSAVAPKPGKNKMKRTVER